jgi:hypothetical protein
MTVGSVAAPPSVAVHPSPAGVVQDGASHPALADLSPEDQQGIMNLARTVDFGDFVDQVMALPTSSGGTMLEQPKVIQALSDEAFYTALRG